LTVFICVLVPSLVLIDQVIFLLEHGHTDPHIHRHTHKVTHSSMLRFLTIVCVEGKDVGRECYMVRLLT